MSIDKKHGSGSKRHGNFSKFIRKEAPKVVKDPKAEKASKPRFEKNSKSSFDKKSKSGFEKNSKPQIDHNVPPIQAEFTRLNKYIANAGICSRRDADDLIVAGDIKINGKVVDELGTKVSRTDRVTYKGNELKAEKLVYVLLNKPKGFITTTDDPYERKTVMNLVEKACEERIFPVGRLDRNTTGLLLFTNDGDMAKKLTHPKHNIKKIYHVVLDKDLAKNDLLKIQNGIELEDGLTKVDKIAYAEESTDKSQIGIEIHSGKNRIVRRLFESLEYQVTRLDRVSFAGLTKKDIPRGRYRKLKDIEINRLKMLG